VDEALKHASNPHEFNLYVSGVEGASDTTWRPLQPTVGATPPAPAPAKSLRTLKR
jgi:hypothetical protein